MLFTQLSEIHELRGVKILLASVIRYSLSPVDLIPDFIPVSGQLDDLIIVPAGISLALRMMPKDIMEGCRRKARMEPIKTRTKWIVAFGTVLIWLLAIYLLFRFVRP
jgi:uncharacterized membrane protein YkvA (DUF1232 family)